MQFLILSDIHANWHALEAVLAHAENGYDSIVCLGDIVGYNAQPAPVTDWIREHCSKVIRGNHDKVVAGVDDLEWFNPIARSAALWTRAHLGTEDLAYLRNLAQGPALLEDFALCHGSPRDEDEYIPGPEEATEVFPHLDLPVTFFGHTHLQGGFFQRHRRVGRIAAVPSDLEEAVLEVDPDDLYLINPGSVGQPRDGDRRAAYAIFDTERQTVALRRVLYPVEKTAAEINAAGLPDALALRLFRGR